MACDHHRHHPYWPRAGDEHVLTHEVEVQCRVYGVAKGVEDRGHVI